MRVFKRDTDRHTYADYLLWSRTFGDELIDGCAYIREPPAPSFSHQAMIGELHLQIAMALKGSPYRVYFAPLDVRLPKSNEDDAQVDTVVQPDLLIVSDLRKIDARGIRGAPDWLAEVLSPGTARYDATLKLGAYERAGVGEVWLIHPIRRTLAIYHLEKGHYADAVLLELKRQTSLASVPGVTIEWDQVLAQVPPGPGSYDQR
jgi:Uma2 family endonuclease